MRKEDQQHACKSGSEHHAIGRFFATTVDEHGGNTMVLAKDNPIA
jgi:hypothetical protein